jgi:hypothetical protein
MPESQRLLPANNQGIKFLPQQQLIRAATTQKPEICSRKILTKKDKYFSKKSSGVVLKHDES